VGIPEQEVQLTSSDPGQHASELTDNEDGTYTATITSSTTPGAATITATDLSTEPKLSGSASLTQDATSAEPAPPPTPPIQPQVSFSVKPPRKGRNRRPHFVFAANVADANFSYKLDGGTYRSCSSPLRLPKLAIGVHSFAVRATTAAGTGSPAVWHFRVLGHKLKHRRHARRDILHAR
jgi:Invasin, domain 3